MLKQRPRATCVCQGAGTATHFGTLPLQCHLRPVGGQVASPILLVSPPEAETTALGSDLTRSHMLLHQRTRKERWFVRFTHRGHVAAHPEPNGCGTKQPINVERIQLKSQTQSAAAGSQSAFLFRLLPFSERHPSKASRPCIRRYPCTRRYCVSGDTMCPQTRCVRRHGVSEDTVCPKTQCARRHEKVSGDTRCPQTHAVRSLRLI